MVPLSWTDNVPEPERDFEDLRDLVAAKAGRLRNRRRLGVASGAVAVVAALLVIATLPGGDAKPRQLQAADSPETSTTVDPSADGTFDPTAVDGTTTTTQTGGTKSTTTTTKRTATTKPASTPVTTIRAEDACGKATYTRATEAELATAATGAWLLCRPGSPFGPAFGGDEAGIELRADGRWSDLLRAGDGSLQRGRDWNDVGTWKAAAAHQLNVGFDGSGTVMAMASFADDRSAMRIDNFMASRAGDYVRVAAGTPIGEAPARPGADDCSRGEGQERRFASASEFSAAATYAWLLCKAPGLFGTSAAGLEIRSDGRWAELDRRADGALVRSSDPKRSGTWAVSDTSHMNGPNTYHIQFSRVDGSGASCDPAFATATTKMRCRVGGDTPPDYIHAPAGTQVVDG